MQFLVHNRPTVVCLKENIHNNVIKSKHFPRYWAFLRGIHRSPVNSSHKGQWRGALVFSLICAWSKNWANNGHAGDLRRHCAHNDVIVMMNKFLLMHWYGEIVTLTAMVITVPIVTNRALQVPSPKLPLKNESRHDASFVASDGINTCHKQLPVPLVTTMLTSSRNSRFSVHTGIHACIFYIKKQECTCVMPRCLHKTIWQRGCFL